jgi:hypothetical protein
MTIVIEHLLETLLSFFVPEGMEKGEPALKFLLNWLVADDGNSIGHAKESVQPVLDLALAPVNLGNATANSSFSLEILSSETSS